MELVLRRKGFVTARVRKIDRLVGGHSYEHLHEREDTLREDAFVVVFAYLVNGLRDCYVRAFEFDMDYGHTVDKQH